MTKILCYMALVSWVWIATVACGGAPQSTESALQPQPVADQPSNAAHAAVVDHAVESLGGEPVELASFRGQPLLIVNTASKCGYTPQYEGLQTLHETYGDQGLVVIGFPSNDFGKQEPGSDEQIGKFCRMNYGVEFPMFSKVRVKGDGAHPVYAYLTSRPAPIGGPVEWNFQKYLVDREGRVVARFEPDVEPLDEEITSSIEALLSEIQPAG